MCLRPPPAGDGFNVDGFYTHEFDGDVFIVGGGADQHRVLRGVFEFQVNGTFIHGCLTARRVTGNVVAVRGVRHILHAGEVGGVVQGRGELANTAADGFIGASVQNNARFHEALRGTARTGVAVEGEGIARCDHCAVDNLGGLANIHA